MHRSRASSDAFVVDSGWVIAMVTQQTFATKPNPQRPGEGQIYGLLNRQRWRMNVRRPHHERAFLR
jgi:hypothetical protein